MGSGSVGTVDSYCKGGADLAHSGVAQTPEPADEDRDRDAFDRVEVHCRTPRHRVVAWFEHDFADESSNRCRAWRHECAAMSRDRTTTGRRPISAISHHQTSPRAGIALTTLPRLVGTTPGRPIRLARRVGARRRRRSSRQPRRSGGELAERREPRPRAQRLSSRTARSAHVPAKTRRPSCSGVCESCHHHATYLQEKVWG